MKITESIISGVSWIIGISLGLAILCIPIWLLWNWLAPIYFYFLPKVYLSLRFRHVFGFFALISIMKSIVLSAPVPWTKR